MTEAEYDEHVAPLLIKAAEETERRGGTLVAFSEWENGQSGETVTLTKGATVSARLVKLAVDVRGNFDGMCMALLKGHREGKIDLSGSLFFAGHLREVK